ncbi:hypothetical protein [Oxobacter pfennigii]|nr:hypothetical protein [Oxobacter pfennigii]
MKRNYTRRTEHEEKTKELVVRRPPNDDKYFAGFLMCAECG